MREETKMTEKLRKVLTDASSGKGDIWKETEVAARILPKEETNETDVKEEPATSEPEKADEPKEEPKEEQKPVTRTRKRRDELN